MKLTVEISRSLSLSSLLVFLLAKEGKPLGLSGGGGRGGLRGGTGGRPALLLRAILTTWCKKTVEYLYHKKCQDK